MAGPVDFTARRNARPLPLKIRSADKFEGEPPGRDWLVPDILVRGGITMLSGDGGVGKSLLCLQLQVAAALGEPWFGKKIREPIRSLGFYCEDDEDEIHRRLHAICLHYSCSMEDLGNNVEIISRIGDQNELMTFSGRNDQGQRTMLLSQLEEHVKAWRVELVLIDTVADTFMGNENVRPQVRAFVNSVRRLAIINAGGVIMTAHPSRAGLSDGTGLSGSTAWNGSVRSRIYLTEPRRADEDILGEYAATDNRVLKTMKSNYGHREKIYLKWQKSGLAGVFAQTDASGQVAGDPTDTASAVSMKNDELVIAAIRWLVQQDTKISQAVQGPSSLAARLRKVPSTRHMSVRQLNDVQVRLLSSGDLVAIDIGPRSRRKAYLRTSDTRLRDEETE